ncbi:hypothetical protein DFQ26_004904 [Actinomortierella ambigua]|nr:hypothetical protein DFQ26_004904 [Actinomortierella ambigua]
MESRKRPNEDDASGPTAVTASTEAPAIPHASSTTQLPESAASTQPAAEQDDDDTKMDVDASSSGEAVPSPTVVAAATLAAKDFSNKRVKLTKEAEKTGSDYSPSSDIPDPATQSTESKGLQDWMKSLAEDNKETPAEGSAGGAKDTAAPSTDKALDHSKKDGVDNGQNVGSQDDQSGTAPSQTVGQLKVNPELLREQEQPSASSTASATASGTDSSSGANDLVRALLAPTDASAPAKTTESAPATTSSAAAADLSESKTSEEISSSILAVASLSEPMVEAAVALDNSRAEETDKSVTKDQSPSNGNSNDLIQLLTNPSGTKVDTMATATAPSSEEETATKQASESAAITSKESTQDSPSADSSTTAVTAKKDDERHEDRKEEGMQVDPMSSTSEPTPKDAKPSTEPSTEDSKEPPTENATVKSPVTRYEGDDIIMTIATGPSAAPQSPVSMEMSEVAEQPGSGATREKTEDDKESQSLPDTQAKDRTTTTTTTAQPEQRPASPLPPITHDHSLSHAVPRLSASDSSLPERKSSLPETLPPISSLSGAQSLPSLHQPPRSSMSLSAMLINNDDDDDVDDEDMAEEPPQPPPRAPRNIFNQPSSATSRGASPSPPTAAAAATATVAAHKSGGGAFQPEPALKTEPTHRAMPRYSPTSSGEITPQQPVDEARAGGLGGPGGGGIGGKEYAADEVMESGGVGGYAGHRHRHGSASDGRPSPVPGGGVGVGSGPMDKLPGLANINQTHGAPSMHAPSGGPPPPPSSGPGQHGAPHPHPPGRFMPGYPPSHQGPPHGSASLPPPPQHAAGHPPPPHHGQGPPPPHHHPHGAPPPQQQQQQSQQQHGPPHAHHHAANGHGHYPGPPPSIMPPGSGHGPQGHGPPASASGAAAPGASAPAAMQQQRPRLIVKNSENLQLPDRPEQFLGYYRYEPGVLLPAMEGKENSVLEVRIASSYLTYDNAKVRKRYLWGTDIYTDDSDVVAMIIHMGLFIPPLSSQSTEQEQFLPQTQQHNFVEYQSVPRHLCPGFDLAVTLRVQPRLVKYQGSIRHRIRSRSWRRTQHDGVSLKVESIRQIPLGQALNRGRSQSKQRVRETNAERLRVLSDRFDDDDTTESLQNEKALRAATFEFTQQGDPCFKYTPELVMDRHDGLSRKWTSWRLKKEVLILENDEERYEISLQHHAGTDSRRFDRYRVAVISPRTSLSLSSSRNNRNPTTYPLDLAQHQLVEILYEDLDWQDFEWVERGVVIQPDRYGTSTTATATTALIPQQQNGGGGAGGVHAMEESMAMEGVETAAASSGVSSGGGGAAAAAMNGRSAGVNVGAVHKDTAGGEYPREEGVFCLVSRLYWRPMSEKRPETTTTTNATTQPAATATTATATSTTTTAPAPAPAPASSTPSSSSSSSQQPPRKEVENENNKDEQQQNAPSAPAAAGDKADVPPGPSSSLSISASSTSPRSGGAPPAAPAAQPESAEKGSANAAAAGTTGATATATTAAVTPLPPPPTSNAMEMEEKEEGELEEGEVAE